MINSLNLEFGHGGMMMPANFFLISNSMALFDLTCHYATAIRKLEHGRYIR